MSFGEAIIFSFLWVGKPLFLHTRLPCFVPSAGSEFEVHLAHSLFSPDFQWDDETDMAKMEECVRSVQMDGLVWGASKLVPVGYGIKKLQIQCVVEDDKVGTDILEEEITKFEDYVSFLGKTNRWLGQLEVLLTLVESLRL